jgi:uncharacterized protein
MPRQTILILFFWISLICPGAAQALDFPTLTGRVVDQAGLLNPADRAALTAMLTALEAKTTDQLVIVTLTSLQGASIEDYGYQLGRRWKIGQKDKDTGVLLIVAASERQVRIEVGYGLEGALTDASTRIIIERAILPRFKEGDFPGGIKRGTEEIIKGLGGDLDGLKADVAQNASLGLQGSNADIPVWPVILLGLAAVGLSIFCMVRGGAICNGLFQVLLLGLLMGRGSASRGGSSFSGSGGSFGGGGSSGSW